MSSQACYSLRVMKSSLSTKLSTINYKSNKSMDWDSAKRHCNERNWQWSLELINQAQKEMEALETKLKKCEDQQKANRLYNACNY